MAKNKIQDLRDHLFETIELLKEGDEKMPIEKARAIAEISREIINTAKVEVDFLRAADKTNGIFPTTGFFDNGPKKIENK